MRQGGSGLAVFQADGYAMYCKNVASISMGGAHPTVWPITARSGLIMISWATAKMLLSGTGRLRITA